MNTKENERENLFQVKRKKCAQKVFDRGDVVRDGAYEAKQAESDDAGRVLSAWRLTQSAFDFRRHFVCALKRSRDGKLQVDIQIALVFVGEKTCGHFVPEPTGPNRESCQQDHRDCAFADEKAA